MLLLLFEPNTAQILWRNPGSWLFDAAPNWKLDSIQLILQTLTLEEERTEISLGHIDRVFLAASDPQRAHAAGLLQLDFRHQNCVWMLWQRPTWCNSVMI
ncbi:hypothetical protein I7I53_10781 [Histoplasma capsulatum var. duboisii H88]|uniref:Uncharacterized protein n=1 Tax=Ajellomyces capsulatus (strain H88) TaxID=544711 RepID=A0A8A1L889_AJEC8|nr:hypothetical protein I7I53_10781 [Histoplasma capsulatum var. duboisii H88]